MAIRKVKVQPKEIHYMVAANKSTVLNIHNIRWSQPSFMLLHDAMSGDGSEHDIDAYLTVGNQFFKVNRFFIDGDRKIDGDLRVFLSIAPVHLDVTALFPNLPDTECFEVTREIQDAIIEKLFAVHKAVIDFWVTTLTSGKSMMEMLITLEPIRFEGEIFASSSILDYIHEQLGLEHRHWDELQRLYSMMFREQLSMPEFAGNSKVRCLVYEKNQASSRYWTSVNSGIACGSLRAELVLKTGRYAVVKAAGASVQQLAESRSITDTAVQQFCEKLIRNGAYDDVILFSGEEPLVAESVQQMSDFLFGVDVYSA